MMLGFTTVLLAGVILLVLLGNLRLFLDTRETPSPKRSISSWTSVSIICLALIISSSTCLWLIGQATQHLIRHIDLTQNLQQTQGIVLRRWSAKGEGYVVAYRFGDRNGADKLWRAEWKLAEPGRPITVYYSAARPDWHALDPWSFLTRALYSAMWSIVSGVLTLILWRERLRVEWGNVPGPTVDPTRSRAS